MKIDIWSDVRCPFCYIGKHKFEAALEQFPHKDKIEVVWRSFELDPDLKTDPDRITLDHLAESKGISRAQAERMTQHAVKAAKEAGLELNFAKAVVANSFNAHRLMQFAKIRDLGSEAEEQLFKAHFTEGINIDDKTALLQTGISIGLDEKEVGEVLFSDAYAGNVRQDEADAQTLGIRGVPFFLFNDKYAVSGAQATGTFLEALTQSWNEFEKENKSKPIIITEGEACSMEGNCH